MRGSGRTYRELYNMFSRVIQDFIDPKFKLIYFFSPHQFITKYCMDMSIRMFIDTEAKYVCSFCRLEMEIRFFNGVVIKFRELKRPLDIMLYHTTSEFCGRGDFLVYEDHTLLEYEISEGVFHVSIEHYRNNTSWENPLVQPMSKPDYSYLKDASEVIYLKHDVDYVQNLRNPYNEAEFKRLMLGEWNPSGSGYFDDLKEKYDEYEKR